MLSTEEATTCICDPQSTIKSNDCGSQTQVVVAYHLHCMYLKIMLN